MNENNGIEKIREAIKIKEAIKKNRLVTKEVTKKEQEWQFYDSDIYDFGGSFRNCLPNGYVYELDKITEKNGLKKYIEDVLSKNNNKNLTAIELGGPGSNLFSGFTEKFFKKTLGICLKDIRNENQKNIDKKKNHLVIVGDIFEILDTKLFEEIKKELGTSKTDLIISRMIGGILKYDKNSFILDQIIRKLYNVLNDNGLIFIETGEEQNIKKWVEALKQKFPLIEIESTPSGTIRLHKNPGAPEELPPASELFLNNK